MPSPYVQERVSFAVVPLFFVSNSESQYQDEATSRRQDIGLNYNRLSVTGKCKEQTHVNIRDSSRAIALKIPAITSGSYAC